MSSQTNLCIDKGAETDDLIFEAGIIDFLGDVTTWIRAENICTVAIFLLRLHHLK